MSHYEQRLERDLTEIKKLVARTGAAVESAIARALKALLTSDKDIAADIVLGDFAINSMTRDMDNACHAFVARHLPSAGHLRFVSSVLRLSIALERIGDYAATISRTVAQLSAPAPEAVGRDLAMMGERSRRTLHQALAAFDSRDAEAARKVIADARELMPTTDSIFADLVREGENQSRPMGDLFGLMATFNRLERVVHQAKNICEETVFVTTGETKPQKTFEVLFIDETNDGASQLAEQISRKGYPKLGSFRSAGWNAADKVSPRFAVFGEERGLGLEDAWPTPLTSLLPHLARFQVIVDLDGRAQEHIGRPPFHTIVLRWRIDVGGEPEEVHRQLAPAIQDLMDRLRGVEPH